MCWGELIAVVGSKDAAESVDYNSNTYGFDTLASHPKNVSETCGSHRARRVHTAVLLCRAGRALAQTCVVDLWNGRGRPMGCAPLLPAVPHVASK